MKQLAPIPTPPGAARRAAVALALVAAFVASPLAPWPAAAQASNPPQPSEARGSDAVEEPAPQESDAQGSSAAEEQAPEQESDEAAAGAIESVLGTLRLPRTVAEAKEEGVVESVLSGMLDRFRAEKVTAGDAERILAQELEVVRAGGPVDNFGAFVQTRLDAGLRGRALADAVRAEHRRRGIGIPERRPERAMGRGRGPDAARGGPEGRGRPEGAGRPDGNGAPDGAGRSDGSDLGDVTGRGDRRRRPGGGR